MNSARVETEDRETGETKVLKEETLDRVKSLWTPGPHPHSEVEMQVGTQHDFGRIVIRACVHLECDQNEKTLDEAGLIAFTKAVEFMNDGLKLMSDS